MTTSVGPSEQEKAYLRYRAQGWEFSYWDGNKLVMERRVWDTTETQRLHSTIEIDEEGKVKEIKDE